MIFVNLCIGINNLCIGIALYLIWILGGEPILVQKILAIWVVFLF